MSLYHPGYNQARETIRKYSEEELLSYLDSMYGRDNLSENYSYDELLCEALEQCRQDFTDKSSDEYSLIQFHIKAAQLSNWK